MDHIEEEAIVLRTTPVREADLFLGVLTRTKGKVTALARGIRKSKRRFMGGVDLFDTGVVTLAPLKSRDHLYVLEGFRSTKQLLGLRSELPRLSAASLCVELASLFAGDDDPEGSLLFEPLDVVLGALANASPAEAEVALLRYILTTLQMSGVDPIYAPEKVRPEVLALWQQVTSPAGEIQRTSKPDPIFRAAVTSALNFTEEVFGMSLRTRPHLLPLVRRANSC